MELDLELVSVTTHKPSYLYECEERNSYLSNIPHSTIGSESREEQYSSTHWVYWSRTTPT